MQFNFGMTQAEIDALVRTRLENERRRYSWHEWFAWHPVEVERGRWVWWETVERRGLEDEWWDSQAYVYRLPVNERPS